MEKIRQLAVLSVSRACGFAGIAITTVMVALSYDLALMTHAGAVLLTLASVVLRLFAMAAPRRNPKRTEVWVMLDPKDAPPPDVAQQVIGTALAETYAMFSRWTLTAGLAFWGVSVLVRLVMGGG